MKKKQQEKRKKEAINSRIQKLTLEEQELLITKEDPPKLDPLAMVHSLIDLLDKMSILPESTTNNFYQILEASIRKHIEKDWLYGDYSTVQKMASELSMMGLVLMQAATEEGMKAMYEQTQKAKTEPKQADPLSTPATPEPEAEPEAKEIEKETRPVIYTGFIGSNQ